MEGPKGDSLSERAPMPMQAQRQGGMAGSPNYSPTADELKALQECRQESFYYRCLPFTLVTIGCMKAVEIRGIMKPGLLKYLSSTLVAYLAGKYSYQRQCQEKLMNVPNSELGDALRSGKSLTQFLHEKKLQVPVRNVPMAEDKTSQVGLYNAPDIDSASNVQHKGLDDNYRVSIDDTSKAMKRGSGEGGSQKGVTYEELRAENRSQFQKRQYERTQPVQAPQTVAPPPSQPDSVIGYSPYSSSDSFSAPIADERPSRPGSKYSGDDIPKASPSRRKNKYGDTIEE